MRPARPFTRAGVVGRAAARHSEEVGGQPEGSHGSDGADAVPTLGGEAQTERDLGRGVPRPPRLTRARLVRVPHALEREATPASCSSTRASATARNLVSVVDETRVR